jgi:hypothetical protein
MHLRVRFRKLDQCYGPVTFTTALVLPGSLSIREIPPDSPLCLVKSPARTLTRITVISRCWSNHGNSGVLLGSLGSKFDFWAKSPPSLGGNERSVTLCESFTPPSNGCQWSTGPTLRFLHGAPAELMPGSAIFNTVDLEVPLANDELLSIYFDVYH